LYDETVKMELESIKYLKQTMTIMDLNTLSFLLAFLAILFIFWMKFSSECYCDFTGYGGEPGDRKFVEGCPSHAD
jgi:hypothetical protein